MKSIIIGLLLLLFEVRTVASQPFSIWGMTMSQPLAICELADSSFLLSAQDYTDWRFPVALIVKISPDGSVAWQNKISMRNYQLSFNSIKEGIDGDYYAAGGDGNSVYLIRITPDGQLKWLSAIGLVHGAFAYKMLLDHNDLIVSGHLVSSYIARFNTAGHQIWKKDFYFDSIAIQPKDADGDASQGICVVGEIPSNNFELFLHKVDGYGNSIAARIFGGQSMRPTSIVCCTDSGYLVTGTMHWRASFADTLNMNQAFVIKFDKDLAIQWAHRFRNIGPVLGQESKDGFVIVGNRVLLNNKPDGASVFMSLDRNGHVVKNASISGVSSVSFDAINSISRIRNGFAITGHPSYGYSNNFILCDSNIQGFCETSDMIEPDSDIHLTSRTPSVSFVEAPNESVISSIYEVEPDTCKPVIYCPAPINSLVNSTEKNIFSSTQTRDQIQINSSTPFSEITMQDLIGRDVLKFTFVPTSSFQVNCQSLAEGIYFLKISSSPVIEKYLIIH